MPNCTWCAHCFLILVQDVRLHLWLLVKVVAPVANPPNLFAVVSFRLNVPEEITFHLLHLSLLREYLELEFQAVKEPLPFEFNLESIIDDWVLMCFLVGNDFIPHLPNLHIAHNALPILYKAYTDVDRKSVV